MGWTEEAAETMVLATASAYKYHYYAVDGSLGTAGTTPTCTATDADPDNGTSDYATSVEEMEASESSSTTKRSIQRSPRIRGRSARV